MSRPLLAQSAANLQRDLYFRLKSPFGSADGGIAPSFKTRSAIRTRKPQYEYRNLVISVIAIKGSYEMRSTTRRAGSTACPLRTFRGPSLGWAPTIDGAAGLLWERALPRGHAAQENESGSHHNSATFLTRIGNGPRISFPARR